VDGVEVLDHEIPPDGIRRERLGVMSDRQVRPASHLEHRELHSYFDGAHSDQFMRRTRVRLRYVQIPLPAEGDSARAPAEAKTIVSDQRPPVVIPRSVVTASAA